MNLHSACAEGLVDEVRRIVRSHSEDVDGQKMWSIPGCVEMEQLVTPMYVAAFFGHTCCLRELILAGADPNLQEERYGQTPCHVAAQIKESDECLRILLAGNADPTITTKAGWTPLSLAALSGSEMCLRVLVSSGGVDIDWKTREGITPCLAAVMGNRPETLRILLAAGADADLTNVRGETPMVTAIEEGYLSCVATLRAHNEAHSECDDDRRGKSRPIRSILRRGLFTDIDRRAIYIILMLADRDERRSGLPFCVWASVLACTVPGGIYYSDCEEERGRVRKARYRGAFGIGWFERACS